MSPDRLLSLSVSCLTHINARCGGLGIEMLQSIDKIWIVQGEKEVFFSSNCLRDGEMFVFWRR